MAHVTLHYSKTLQELEEAYTIHQNYFEKMPSATRDLIEGMFFAQRKKLQKEEEEEEKRSNSL